MPPAYALKIAPWMFRFWRACQPGRVAHSTAAQTALMDLSKAELEPFLGATGTAPMLRKEGNLQVYEGEAEFKASLAGWKARADHGIEFRHLDAAGIAEIQPAWRRASPTLPSRPAGTRSPIRSSTRLRLPIISARSAG